MWSKLFRVVRLWGPLFLSLSLTSLVNAQTNPDKPVKLIVSLAPGGGVFG